MQRVRGSVPGLFIFVAFALSVSARQAPQPQPAGVYTTRCGGCHGPTMAGATGPAILPFVRYHVDAEVSEAIRQRHASIALSPPDLQQLLGELRLLARTNPAMATGGYTGRRGGGPGAAAA